MFYLNFLNSFRLHFKITFVIYIIRVISLFKSPLRENSMKNCLAARLLPLALSVLSARFLLSGVTDTEKRLAVAQGYGALGQMTSLELWRKGSLAIINTPAGSFEYTFTTRLNDEKSGHFDFDLSYLNKISPVDAFPQISNLEIIKSKKYRLLKVYYSKNTKEYSMQKSAGSDDMISFNLRSF